MKQETPKLTYHQPDDTYRATFEDTTLIVRGDAFREQRDTHYQDMSWVDELTDPRVWYGRIGQSDDQGCIIAYWQPQHWTPIVVPQIYPTGKPIKRKPAYCLGCGTQTGVKTFEIATGNHPNRTCDSMPHMWCKRCAQHIAETLEHSWDGENKSYTMKRYRQRRTGTCVHGGSLSLCPECSDLA